jgi:hypothetical protein
MEERKTKNKHQPFKKATILVCPGEFKNKVKKTERRRLKRTTPL